MKIQKDGKEYLVEECQSHWSISCSIDKLSVKYEVPKDICADETALLAYILAEELF